MLTLGVIANIRAFMERAQLSGKEVQAYNEIMTALAREEAQLTSLRLRLRTRPRVIHAHCDDVHVLERGRASLFGARIRR